MAAFFNLKNKKISKELLVNKFNIILDNKDNEDRLVLNNQSITSPQRSTGFYFEEHLRKTASIYFTTKCYNK